MTNLALIFSESESPSQSCSLFATRFAHPLLERDLCCVRGAVTGGGEVSGSFPWSAGVRALCILLLRTVAAGLEGDTDATIRLSGRRATPAIALDSALAKVPRWITEIFGCDRDGVPIARRIITRINPEARRPGPVILTVTKTALKAECIEVSLGEERIYDPQRLALMADEIQKRGWPKLVEQHVGLVQTDQALEPPVELAEAANG